jgi:hypothetical protein
LPLSISGNSSIPHLDVPAPQAHWEKLRRSLAENAETNAGEKEYFPSEECM